MQKNNTFSKFLNIVLSILLTGMLVFIYIFGNFGGISLKELKGTYIPKKDIKFSNLPKSIQEKYIDKTKLDNVLKQKDSEAKKYFDDNGNPVEIMSDNSDELKNVIKSLQNRIMSLEQTNISLSDDKDELLKVIKNNKSKISENKKNILSSNLEKMNEVEKQHYQNISELTMKINNLQRENIRLTEAINQEDENKKDEILKLKKQIDEVNKKIMLVKSKIKKDKNSQIADFEVKIKKLKSIIKNSKNDLQKQKDENIVNTSNQEHNIYVLQIKINNLIKEKNNLLTKSSKTILEIGKQNSQKFKDLDKVIKKYKKEKNDLKIEYELKIAKLNEQIKQEKDSKVNILDNTEKKISSLRKKFEANNNENKKIYTEKENELKLNNQKIKADLEKITLTNKQISYDKNNLEFTLNSSVDRVLQLQDKIKEIEDKNTDFNTKVNVLISKNEKVHNKNYEIFNNKIASLEEKIKLYETNYNNLQTKYDSSKTKLIKLNKKIVELEKLKDILKLSENEKLVNIKNSFEALQSNAKNREIKYGTIISELKNEISNKNIELKHLNFVKEKQGDNVRKITRLKKILKDYEKKDIINTNKNKNNKMVLLDSIECGDMNSGNFKVSSTCKIKINKFLNKFNANNYFEVIPIVGLGGFSSLNLIKKEGALGIPNSEIKRLTDLANLGLGKHRAKEGGWLIRKKFGDNVKISYAVYNIDMKRKKGFIIRVYK